MQLRAFERIDEAHHVAVGPNQHHLAIGREFQSGPLHAWGFGTQLEAREGPFIEGTEVVELDGFGVDACGEDQAFRIESSNRPTDHVHQTLTVLRTEVPQTYGFVQGARQESVVYGGHT